MAAKGRSAVNTPGVQNGINEAALTEKEATVMKLRIQGMGLDEIAAHVGYSNASGAFHCLKRALAKTLQEPGDELRKMEAERLDRLFEVAFRRATDADSKTALVAIDRCLAIQARRAALVGLDAPVRIEQHVITEDAVDAEIARLSQQLRERETQEA